MRLKIKFFGWARELAGRGDEELEVNDGLTGEGLLDLLTNRHPGLKRIAPILTLSVNMEYTPAQTTLKEGDEIALIPPVSGGRDLGKTF